MSGEHEKRDRGRLQHEAEHARPRKKVSVLGYLTILFAAAFLLLLLSYFMQQRTSQDTIDDLKSSVNAMQSVGDLVEQNKALHEENDTLKTELEALREQNSALDDQNRRYYTIIMNQEKEITSMDWLWRIQRAYSRGAKADAKKLAQEFEAADLPRWLPSDSSESAYFPDGPSPAEQYAALLDALGMSPAEP